MVQHFQLFLWNWKSGGWAWTFTQEWPVGGQAHQLSFTALLSRVERHGGTATGLGDLALNYRYQLIGSGDSRVAMAPRLSVFFPTGSYARSLGAGAAGIQVGLPVSVVMSDRFVTHWNAGALWTPQARDEQGDRAALVIPYAGASVVFLAQPTWNVLLETLWVRTESVAGSALGRDRGNPALEPRISLRLESALGPPDRRRCRCADRCRSEPRAVLRALLPELRAPVHDGGSLTPNRRPRVRRTPRPRSTSASPRPARRTG